MASPASGDWQEWDAVADRLRELRPGPDRQRSGEQIQLDVYGELIDASLRRAEGRASGNAASWAMECVLVEHVESIWEEPDDGIWEVRGGRKHFTHSKVMAWVAFDRVIRSVEESGWTRRVAHWREHSRSDSWPSVRERIRPGAEQLCAVLRIEVARRQPAADRHGWLSAGFRFPYPRNPGRYRKGPDSRRKGSSQRYHTSKGADGLPPGEGVFLACSFWLADNYVLQGRLDEARALFEKLLSLRNDVGLLAEEYDPSERRQLGNFPQAFSHLALINTAHNLTSANGAARQRSGR